MPYDNHCHTPLALRNILMLVILLMRVRDVILIGEVTCTSDGGNEQCTVKVTENIPEGTTIFDVLEHYSNIVIVHHEVSASQYLSISSSRYVQTVGDFDREAMVDASTAPYPLHFTVSFYYDSNDDIFLILVTISVKDIDDNVPTFYINNKAVTNNSVTSETPETTSSASKLITTLVARDYDEGANGTQEYSIGEGSSTYFNISVEKPNNGVPIVKLKSNGELDREEQAHHIVYIIAKEGNDAPDSATVNVSISLIDIDDNTPSFATTEYSQAIFKNATVGTFVVQVVAEDPDYGSNAAISYSISSICSKENKSASCKTVSESSWPFTLNMDSGMLTSSKMLNIENAVSYIITIKAKNPNNPNGGSSTAIVTVEVCDDVNQVININTCSGSTTLFTTSDYYSSAAPSTITSAISTALFPSVSSLATPHTSSTSFELFVTLSTTAGSSSSGLLATPTLLLSFLSIAHPIKSSHSSASLATPPTLSTSSRLSTVAPHLTTGFSISDLLSMRPTLSPNSSSIAYSSSSASLATPHTSSPISLFITPPTTTGFSSSNGIIIATIGVAVGVVIMLTIAMVIILSLVIYWSRWNVNKLRNDVFQLQSMSGGTINTIHHPAISNGKEAESSIHLKRYVVYDNSSISPDQEGELQSSTVVPQPSTIEPVYEDLHQYENFDDYENMKPPT